MILFHGSNMPIDAIDLSKSKPNKDFGRAFYLSPDLDQAKEMASFKADILGGSEIISQFEIDSFDGLHLKVFESYSKEWAHFVFDHRNEPTGNTLHNYDVVYGPIANDRIGAQITRFKQGYITFDEFLNRIKYVKGITFQYAFCTKKAIDRLRKL